MHVSYIFLTDDATKYGENWRAVLQWRFIIVGHFLIRSVSIQGENYVVAPCRMPAVVHRWLILLRWVAKVCGGFQFRSTFSNSPIPLTDPCAGRLLQCLERFGVGTCSSWRKTSRCQFLNEQKWMALCARVVHFCSLDVLHNFAQNTCWQRCIIVLVEIAFI